MRLLDPARERGFTVVELLIVVVIIGVLATLVTNMVNDSRARAQAGVLVSNFSQIEKGFLLKAIEDGIPAWWSESTFSVCAGTDEGNPRIEGMIENCGFDTYLQNVSSLDDVRNFTYDADNNTFAGCGSTLHAGVNIAVHDDLSYSMFEQINNIVDSPNESDIERCGKVRWGNGNDRLFFLIDESASGFSS